ncbi:MAG: transposase [Parvibaculaceae bacterium]
MARRRFSREEKIAAIKRMLAGEDPVELSRELNVPRQMFYQWRARFLSGGAAALRNPGRPRQVADDHGEKEPS